MLLRFVPYTKSVFPTVVCQCVTGAVGERSFKPTGIEDVIAPRAATELPQNFSSSVI